MWTWWYPVRNSRWQLFCPPVTDLSWALWQARASRVSWLHCSQPTSSLFITQNTHPLCGFGCAPRKQGKLVWFCMILIWTWRWFMGKSWNEVAAMPFPIKSFSGTKTITNKIIFTCVVLQWWRWQSQSHTVEGLQTLNEHAGTWVIFNP